MYEFEKLLAISLVLVSSSAHLSGSLSTISLILEKLGEIHLSITLHQVIEDADSNLEPLVTNVLVFIS